MHVGNKTSPGFSLLFRRISVYAAASLLLLLAAISYGHAQDEDQHGPTFQVGAGYSPLVADISSRLNNGWHVTFGGGYNFVSHFAMTLNYTYHGFGVKRRVLDEAGVPDGNAHLWSITVDPKLRVSPHSKIDPYLVGGVGYYRRTINFTRPALVTVFIYDPFFGDFYNTLVPANQVIGTITRGGIGGSAGGGFDYKLPRSGLKIYVEARYHYADTGRVATRMVPLTFGIRW